jgi:hypothetical protein
LLGGPANLYVDCHRELPKAGHTGLARFGH